MSLTALPAELVEYMRVNCPGRTDEALQQRFGISYNTWRKLERGRPIRSSVASRLIGRLGPEAFASRGDRPIGNVPGG